MNTKILQNNLIDLRQEKGMTQKDLAKTINYSDKVISKWERGESQPNIEAISILAEFFNVSIDFLVGKDVTVSQNEGSTIELDVIRTGSPSFLAYLFIVPFAVLFGVILIISPNDIAFGLFTLGIGIVFYSFIISKATFESTYKGTPIRIVNRAFSCKFYIGKEMVEESKNPFRVNPVMNGFLSQDKIKVVLSNMTSIKCRIYVN